MNQHFVLLDPFDVWNYLELLLTFLDCRMNFLFVTVLFSHFMQFIKVTTSLHEISQKEICFKTLFTFSIHFFSGFTARDMKVTQPEK